jgi:NADPH:quinone reductase-like Zn-dependent oxidoreductase
VKAIVHERYGIDALELREIQRPTPGDGEMLVRVRAASLNPFNRYMLTGTPWFGRLSAGLRSPKDIRLGSDFAGTVEAVGPVVTAFRPGDDVFGVANGAFAEYVCVPADGALASKPGSLTFEQAAAVPLAAITALQGLRDAGALLAGEKVLVNGASGGVGTFAVQIAKELGAEVTAVCSTGNVEQAGSLGADDVVDYTREDFTRRGRRYDLLLDVTGTRSWVDYRRALEPEARLVLVGAPKGRRLLGPAAHMAKVRLAALRSSRKVVFCMAKMNQPDLTWLRGQLETGAVRPILDRSYDLAQIADAFRYLGEGHAKGKIVVTVP